LRADYSKYLRSIPATVSECNAHFALEPQQLAKLGLSDASKALGLQPQAAEALTQTAWAHILLEDYSAAEAAALQALALDANDPDPAVKVCYHVHMLHGPKSVDSSAVCL
jgi:Flp pilus assembly protein TadD